MQRAKNGSQLHIPVHPESAALHRAPAFLAADDIDQRLDTPKGKKLAKAQILDDRDPQQLQHVASGGIPACGELFKENGADGEQHSKGNGNDEKHRRDFGRDHSQQ
jgi:hypothetical protein